MHEGSDAVVGADIREELRAGLPDDLFLEQGAAHGPIARVTIHRPLEIQGVKSKRKSSRVHSRAN